MTYWMHLDQETEKNWFFKHNTR